MVGTIFTGRIGRNIEKIIKCENKYGRKEMKEERIGEVEISVIKLGTEPLYELTISLNKRVDNSNNEEYTIKNITKSQIEYFIGELKKKLI